MLRTLICRLTKYVTLLVVLGGAAKAAADALNANRHTLKDKFTELVQKGYAELHGKGRGAHYRRVRKWV